MSLARPIEARRPCGRLALFLVAVALAATNFAKSVRRIGRVQLSSPVSGGESKIPVLRHGGSVTNATDVATAHNHIATDGVNSKRTDGPADHRRRTHIVLVENRDVEREKTYGYYTFAMWQLYRNIRPDVNLLVYNSSDLCGDGRVCSGHMGARVAPYWMKVQAVRNAMDYEAGEGDLVAFMDTDTQIQNANFARHISELEEVRDFLRSGKDMLVVTEYVDSWWDAALKKEGIRGYRAPVVSNMFMVINNPAGRHMMQNWWHSAVHPTAYDPTGKDMLTKWPFEQERLAAYYHDQPDLFYTLNQSWYYFGPQEKSLRDASWLNHGPLCCVGFNAKHDIVRSLRDTITNQTRSFSLVGNGTYDYDGTVHELFRQIHIRPLQLTEKATSQQLPRHHLRGFWNSTDA